MPISYHHGVLDAGSPLPLDGTDPIAVCGFLGHAPVPYLAN